MYVKMKKAPMRELSFRPYSDSGELGVWNNFVDKPQRFFLAHRIRY